MENTMTSPMMTNLSCITDKPLKNFKNDYLEAEKYAKALYNFITDADTPVTIGIQGGWGSGKTSLISGLQYMLERDDPEHRTLCVTVNAWEHSLFHEAEDKASVALSLLRGMAQGINDSIDRVTIKKDSSENDKCWLPEERAKELLGKENSTIDTAIKGIKFACAIGSRIGAQFLLNSFVGGGSAKEVVGDASRKVDASQNTPPLSKYVSDLKQALNKKIEMLTVHGKQLKVVFFIDDLDRVQPPTAVEILDITKNIFDFENCIFVLAVDYEVVVKGLREKYGEKTKENEREFRQYFDKIIQIPFTMPIGAYSSHIADLIKPVLDKFGYNDLFDEDRLGRMAMSAQLATGGIPRSIKRILNTFSLIQYISRSDEIINHEHKSNADNSDKTTRPANKEINKLDALEIQFIIVALHIHYPEICRCLLMKKNFTDWTFAELESLWELDKNSHLSEIESRKLSEYFNDEWEQVLYCVCAKNEWLKKQALNISQLLNSILRVLNGSIDFRPIKPERLEILKDALKAINVVTIATDNEGSDDDLEDRNDNVTVFSNKVHKFMAETFGDIVTQPKDEYSKRDDKGRRVYSIPLYNKDINKFEIVWLRNDNILQISAWAKIPDSFNQNTLKSILEKTCTNVGNGFNDKYFYVYVQENFAYEQFEGKEASDFLTQLYSIISATNKAIADIKKF